MFNFNTRIIMNHNLIIGMRDQARLPGVLPGFTSIDAKVVQRRPLNHLTPWIALGLSWKTRHRGTSFAPPVAMMWASGTANIHQSFPQFARKVLMTCEASKVLQMISANLPNNILRHAQPWSWCIDSNHCNHQLRTCKLICTVFSTPVSPNGGGY